MERCSNIMKTIIEINKQIKKLGLWYQSIPFGSATSTKHSTSNTVLKWNRLVVPSLPYILKDKSVFELGCNAGYFLIESIRAGAKKATGLEVGSDFYNQSQFTLQTLSDIDNVVYKEKIKIFNEDAKTFIFKEKVDITFAFNFLYWLTYSDRNGSIDNAEAVMHNFLSRLSKNTKYLLIIGGEGVARERKRKGLNSICTGINETLPFITPYFDIRMTELKRMPKKRFCNIILCRSKNEN